MYIALLCYNLHVEPEEFNLATADAEFLKELIMAKRLYKSSEKKLSGVCAGIAEYMNLDPTLVRLGWVILTCLSFGTGIVAYIVCALVIPDRPSDSSDWTNMRRANEYTEDDKEFNSYFENDRKNRDRSE